MSSIILVVDDDLQILNAIKRLLRRQSCFTVVAVDNGAEALNKLQQIKPSVILSDMRMPKMDGLTFLSQAKDIYPDAIRMVLSAFADTELIIETINRGEVWRYLLKPWEDSELVQAISNGVDLYDAHRREKVANLKVKQINARLQSIISSVHDAVLITDIDGKCIIFNSAFESIYHTPIKLHHLDDFFNSIHSDTTILEMVNSGKAQGRIGNIHVDISAGKYDESLHLGGNLILIIRDITKEHEFDQLKSDFVTSVSHELRTPLSSIIGFSKMMVNNDSLSREEIVVFLEKINQEGERLSALVENVLDLSSIEAGNFHFSFQPVSLQKVINETVETLSKSIEDTKLTLDISSLPTKTIINGDPKALKQVFMNLIGNSIKFTKPGGVIHISCIEEALVSRVTIADSGIGISPEVIPHIFDRFYRSIGSTATGAGIGLHLIKKIIDAHHGSISVESEVGASTTFTLLFPKG
jgi:signal transduction histidine kinase